MFLILLESEEIKLQSKRIRSTQLGDSLSEELYEEMRPPLACPEISSEWGWGTFFKKAKNEKDQRLHREEAVKDHL